MSVIYNFYGDPILVTEKHIKDGKLIPAIYKYACNFCLKHDIKDKAGKITFPNRI